MSDSEPIYRTGRVIAGRYRITSPLSQGGMGAVYLAQQVSLGRDVALKVMLERGSDPELVKRFDVEARAVCQLKHPNIITYHDYGRDDDGQPYLVMEYLAGYPGTKLVYGERRPGLLDLVHVIVQVCSALHEAHVKGIIHRDLKWSNVMICPQSHDPFFAKLIDFGIMKVATDGSSGDQRALTRTGMLLGTPEYMSPEAICGMPIDGRADQYSLAIMMWEALEGHRPFDAASHFELLRQQVQEAPPPFEAAAELVGTYPEVEAVILQAMEKHPDDRYENIIAFRQALMVAVGLAQAPATSPARPAAKVRAARGGAATPSFGVERGSERARQSGMPSSRTRLPAAPLTGPRPVDTRVKTGQPAAESGPKKLHWAWLVAGFLVFVGIGFGTVLAILGGKSEAAATDAVALVDLDKPDAGATDAVRNATTGEQKLAEEKRLAEEKKAAEVAAERVNEKVAAAPDTVVAEVVPAQPNAVGAAPNAPDVTVAVVEAAKVEKVAVAVEPEKVATKEKSGADDGGVAKAVDEPKAPAAPGRLFVQVDPWGNVAVDGRPVGRAPYEGEMKAGMHTVTVTNNFFKGSYTFKIRVESGKRAARTVLLEQHLEKVE